MPYPVAAVRNKNFNVVVGGGGGGIVWLLRDEFTDTRFANTVNGTPPTPGPGGNRVVVDGNSKLSVGVGPDVLAVQTGGVGSIEPRISYDQQTRVAGMPLIQSMNIITEGIRIGLSRQNTNARVATMRFNVGDIEVDSNDSDFITIGNFSTSTQYQTGIVLRSMGCYYFIKGGAFTNWTLLYYTATRSDNPFPIIGADDNTSIFAVDFIRIPDEIYLPTPLAYDTFTRANGVLGNSETSGPDSQTITARGWSGATWAIDTNEAKNTPTETGEELLDNPGFEGVYTGGGTLFLAPNWSDLNMDTGGDTAGEELVVIHSGTKSQHIDVSIGNEGLRSNTVLVTANKWYAASAWVYPLSGAVELGDESNRFDFSASTTGTGAWEFLRQAGRVNATGDEAMHIRSSGVSAAEFYVDDASFVELTLSTLFASLETSTVDVKVRVKVATLMEGTQCGLVARLDSVGTPANFIIAYFDGSGGIKVDENVAGSYANLLSVFQIFTTDDEIEIDLSGSAIRIYYITNSGVSILLGSTTTSVLSGDRHGIFSTNPDNRISRVDIFPKGSDNNEFSGLDRYIT